MAEHLRNNGKNRSRSYFHGSGITADFYRLRLERNGIFLRISLIATEFENGITTLRLRHNGNEMLETRRYCVALEQWASAKVCGAVQGMELQNFRRGRHLYSAGRPSRWASAHILVRSCSDLGLSKVPNHLGMTEDQKLEYETHSLHKHNVALSMHAVLIVHKVSTYSVNSGQWSTKLKT